MRSMDARARVGWLVGVRALVRRYVGEHLEATGSTVARRILANWDAERIHFVQARQTRARAREQTAGTSKHMNKFRANVKSWRGV